MTDEPGQKKTLNPYQWCQRRDCSLANFKILMYLSLPPVPGVMCCGTVAPLSLLMVPVKVHFHFFCLSYVVVYLVSIVMAIKYTLASSVSADAKKTSGR